MGSFPVGFLYPTGPVPPTTSPLQYRWSVLAQMAPYLEQAALSNALNFDFPIASKPTGGSSAFWPFYPANTTAMATTVALFLCPSDGAPPPTADSGPTNYAFCAGDGSDGGDATGANGAFILGPAISLADLTDGRATTVAASEQLLGIAGPYTQTTPTPVPSPRAARSPGSPPAPLTDAACAAAGAAGCSTRGPAGGTATTSTRSTTTTCRRTPPRHDCVTYHNPGWKAARSLHPGGVNVLFCDGHVAFVRDAIHARLWRASATRGRGRGGAPRFLLRTFSPREKVAGTAG